MNDTTAPLWLQVPEPSELVSRFGSAVDISAFGGRLEVNWAPVGAIHGKTVGMDKSNASALRLADMYFNGEGVNKDPRMAVLLKELLGRSPECIGPDERERHDSVIQEFRHQPIGGSVRNVPSLYVGFRCGYS